MGKRITIRLNEREAIELELLKKTFHVEADSEAFKLAVAWVNNYLKNVTEMFFPSTHEVILRKKLKSDRPSRRVF